MQYKNGKKMALKTLYKMCVMGALMQFSSSCISFKVNNPFYQNEQMDVTLRFGRSVLNDHNSDKNKLTAISLEFRTEQVSPMPAKINTPFQVETEKGKPSYVFPEKNDGGERLRTLLNEMFEKTL